MNAAYELARKDIGTWEWAEGHNPKVVQYFADVGHAWVKDDETAWCAAYVGAMLQRAGMPHTGELTARSYLKWGLPVDVEDAQEGDICVFKRGTSSWQGHVGFFVKQSNGQILLLGGNQKNQVNESWYNIFGQNALLGVRRAEEAVSAAPVGPDEDIHDLLSRAMKMAQDMPEGREREYVIEKIFEANNMAGAPR